MPALKTGINKLLNLLHQTISNHPFHAPKENSFIWVCFENNKVLESKLKKLKPLIREINAGNKAVPTQSEIKAQFLELEKFTSYYTLKENVLFPVIEAHLPEFRCLKVMWSFHDDIKKNMATILKELARPHMDMKKFNKLAGDIFLTCMP